MSFITLSMAIILPYVGIVWYAVRLIVHRDMDGLAWYHLWIIAGLVRPLHSGQIWYHNLRDHQKQIEEMLLRVR